MRALITGSFGLVGSSAALRLLRDGWKVVGIDNGGRGKYFGEDASTNRVLDVLAKHPGYRHLSLGVHALRDDWHLYFRGIDLVIHCAAQPSHDWATTHIREDFAVNAVGTLNMLEAWKASCPGSPFIHVSTSKVYGDAPNGMAYRELADRYEIDEQRWRNGFDESLSVDQRLHSFFGVSKLTGDLLAQEYGRHFGMPIGIFRPGCVTGGAHAGTELHGFLAYMMKRVKSGKEYKVIGYGGKQVRCNVHADDLVKAFLLFASRPRFGEVYNIGGRGLDCSVIEALKTCERLCGRPAMLRNVPLERTGDHKWWVSDITKLQLHYQWKPDRTLEGIFEELHECA